MKKEWSSSNSINWEVVMKIAIDARMLDARYTGVGSYTKNLIASLRNIDAQNQYVLLVGNNFASKISKDKNFKIVRWRYRPFSLRSIFLLYKLLVKERIDIFHSPFCVVPLLAKCPVILTIHDLMAIKYPGFFAGRRFLARILGRTYFRIFMTLSLKKAGAILVDSEQIKEDLIDFMPSTRQKITVVYAGVDESFQQIKEERRIALFRKVHSLKGKTVLYLGSIRPHKNVDRLIKAFSILVSQLNTECQLIIAGEKDKNLLILRNLVDQLGLSNKTIFLNHVPEGELLLLMNAADIFVFPSLYEGFGLPPLEAMACGTPVVASNTASIPEVVGEAAILVNPKNEQEIASAMLRLLIDDSLRQELIREGFQRIRLFSWENTAKETIGVYQTVMAERLTKKPKV
jgi:glycosyltransferase involved in cell wall biosynthesis